MSREPQSSTSTAAAPEGRGAFGGFIGPRTLVGLVAGAAPYLFDASSSPAHAASRPASARLIDHGFEALGWWRILLAADLLRADASPDSRARADYFALCLSAHFASAATYVPTDVDAKIRGALWFDPLAREDLERMRELALHLVHWDVSGISARIVDVDDVGALSGHDGERLSVWCGAWMACVTTGDESAAQRFEHEIDAELEREARAFAALCDAPGRECDLLRAAAILTHNAGDVMQGLSSKGARDVADARKRRFTDLARERFERYGGAFGRAAALYRELMASEGHRNYPLREVKLLRADPELLLPLGPFLDEWGGKLARWPRWSPSDRAEVVATLIDGCRKVRGQEGYYRALAGFDAAYPGGIEARDLVAHYGSSVKRELKNPELKRKIAVKRESFESSCRKRARAVLARAL
jgi:hypothetical protein